MEAYPELKEHVEHMLDVVENVGGRANKANDAEIQVVDNMRKIGAAALQEWAVQREKTATTQWAEEHPASIKHGKKVHWETTIGRREVIVQRFLHKQKLIVPFTQEVGVDCRDYSILLERAIVDFGADTSFGQAVEKFKEHYGISISVSAVQSITKKHAEACYAMQEKDADLPGKNSTRCLIGAMIPIVIFEANKYLDKRKWRKTGWKEARLSMVREHKSLTKIFLAMLGSTERAGDLLGRCARRLGYKEQTTVHCLGDGAFWIREQVERVFGTKGNYLVDFFHLSEYLSGASETCCAQEAKKWLGERQEEMKVGRVGEVIELLRNYEQRADVKNADNPVRKCLRYMENRPGQFKYKEALAADLPIGSGEIEVWCRKD